MFFFTYLHACAYYRLSQSASNGYEKVRRINTANYYLCPIESIDVLLVEVHLKSLENLKIICCDAQYL